jgi:hypothetical protein
VYRAISAFALLATGCAGADICLTETPLESVDDLVAIADCGTAAYVQGNGQSMDGGDTLETLDWSGLKKVTGRIELIGFPALREVIANDLTSINSPNGDALLLIDQNPSLERASFAFLDQVTNWDTTDAKVTFSDLPSLTLLDLTALPEAEGLKVVGTGLTSVSLPALTRLDNNLEVSQNSALTSINFPHLAELQSLGFNDNPLLASCDAHAVLDQITLAMGEEPQHHITGNKADHCGD